MRKNWGYEEVTSPTLFKFQAEFVTSGFQRPDLTLILSNLLFITDVLNLFWFFKIVVRCHSMRHKVVAHKVIIRQVTIISYSPVIQIKLYVGGLVGLAFILNKIKLSCLMFPSY